MSTRRLTGLALGILLLAVRAWADPIGGTAYFSGKNLAGPGSLTGFFTLSWHVNSGSTTFTISSIPTDLPPSGSFITDIGLTLKDLQFHNSSTKVTVGGSTKKGQVDFWYGSDVENPAGIKSFGPFDIAMALPTAAGYRIKTGDTYSFTIPGLDLTGASVGDGVAHIQGLEGNPGSMKVGDPPPNGVPEPSSVLLVGIGLLTLGITARFSAKK